MPQCAIFPSKLSVLATKWGKSWWIFAHCVRILQKISTHTYPETDMSNILPFRQLLNEVDFCCEIKKVTISCTRILTFYIHNYRVINNFCLSCLYNIFFGIFHISKLNWSLNNLTLKFESEVESNEWYFVTKIILTYWEKKIVLLIEKNFWNLRLKPENLEKFWDHQNIFFQSVKGQNHFW